VGQAPVAAPVGGVREVEARLVPHRAAAVSAWIAWLERSEQLLSGLAVGGAVAALGGGAAGGVVRVLAGRAA